MKAIVYHKYGSPDVLKLADIAKPLPNDNQVLVKVHSASVNPLDWHYMRGKPFLVRFMGVGFFKPKKGQLGVDIAGRVEAVGKNVSQFKIGDEVFGGANINGFAEYVSIVEKRLVLKPAHVSFDNAASVPIAAMTALQALRDNGKIQSGQKVLINGASGGVGTFAVQIAKSYNTEVTGVCSSRNMEMVKSIGADYVIDYTKDNFTNKNKRYDLILDTAAYHLIGDYRRVLNSNGRFVMVGGSMALMMKLSLFGFVLSSFGNKKFGGMMTKINNEDLHVMKELLDTGKVKAVIDRKYPLDKTVEAIRYLEEGHARGKVIIEIL